MYSFPVQPFFGDFNQMKILPVFAFLTAAMLSNSALSASFGKVRQVENVSVISLIASPEKYDGKPVRVTGAVRLEFEGKALCLHQEDLTQRLYANCLWIQPDVNALAADERTLSALNNQYVILEGTFRKDERGHRSMYSGAVTGIWRVQSREQTEK